MNVSTPKPLLTVINVTAMFLLVFGGCDRSQEISNGTDFRIAMDQSQEVSIRNEAILRLSYEDQKKICRLLAKQLPGDWDVKTMDTIDLLGTIGNSETVVELRQVLDSPVDIPGKIYLHLEDAIKRIQSREQNQKSFHKTS